jgi:hypothetical protein
VIGGWLILVEQVFVHSNRFSGLQKKAGIAGGTLAVALEGRRKASLYNNVGNLQRLKPLLQTEVETCQPLALYHR